jgi:hypothetical protein
LLQLGGDRGWHFRKIALTPFCYVT